MIKQKDNSRCNEQIIFETKCVRKQRGTNVRWAHRHVFIPLYWAVDKTITFSSPLTHVNNNSQSMRAHKEVCISDFCKKWAACVRKCVRKVLFIVRAGCAVFPGKHLARKLTLGEGKCRLLNLCPEFTCSLMSGNRIYGKSLRIWEISHISHIIERKHFWPIGTACRSLNE